MFKSEAGQSHVGIQQLQSEVVALRWVRKARMKGEKDSAGEQYVAAEGVASSVRLAVAYDKAAQSSSLEVLPVLRYYQWLHLTKALLFLFVPNFPKSASVLQHGLSVRRIKRSNYRWPLEKLQFHNDGIIQCFHHLIAGTSLPDKVLVGDLIGAIPQMSSTLSEFYQQFHHIYPLRPLDEQPGLAAVSRDIASHQDLTITEWYSKYQSLNPSSKTALKKIPSVSNLPGLLCIESPPTSHPWYRTYKNTVYLTDVTVLPEYLIHYCLLYSLSALSRYSAEEWSDVINWSNTEDALLIREYLNLTLPLPNLTDTENENGLLTIEWHS